MRRCLVEVYVPSLGTTYDIFISKQCLVYELVELIGQSVQTLSNGYYNFSGNSVLCYRETGKMLDINLKAEKAGITDGSQLLLI